MFTEPKPLDFPTERGGGYVSCYRRTPWGTLIEFIARPSPMPYAQHTALRRWKP
ncbi:VOC family protein [Enterobacter sp.]|uniref:VOC family protein n=1 Tax=Enterobacter sp. TaxID=42895 RepID=UPI0039922FB2